MEMIRSVDRTFWWEVARRCDYATFFHTPLWHEIALRNHPNFRDASVGFILTQGRRAVLPLLSTRRLGPLQSLLSTFEYCYGGVIADGPLSADELREIYRRSCAWNVTGMRFLENPLAARHDLTETFVGSEYTTHIIDLDVDFEGLLKRLPKGRRKEYRKGLNEGVTVEIAQNLEDYQAYYRTYQDTIRRWGEDPATYGYAWSIFKTIFEIARAYPELIKLWVARLDGDVIGGTVAFYWNRHVVAWHGCAYTAYLKYKPYVVLDLEIVRDALAQGYEFYDLNPTGGLSAGVSDYKLGLGTKVYPVTNWQYQSPALQHGVRLIRALRQRVDGARRGFAS